MSEIRDKVVKIAADMFKHLVAKCSDDPQSLDRASLLGRLEYSNYLATCPAEFLCDRGLLFDLWKEQNPVKFFMFRKTRECDELEFLNNAVRHYLRKTVALDSRSATTVLDEVFEGDWKFNPAEIGYLWRLIHDLEFPIMPGTHSVEHDAVANLASMGATPEEVIQLANFLETFGR